MSARRCAAVLLVFALLAAQTLGLLHRHAHASAPAAVAAHAAGVHCQQAHSPAMHGMAAAFAVHDEGSAECRLFDQIARADAAISVLILPAPVPPSLPVLRFSHGEAVSRWVALFDARGPPFIH